MSATFASPIESLSICPDSFHPSSVTFNKWSGLENGIIWTFPQPISITLLNIFYWNRRILQNTYNCALSQKGLNLGKEGGGQCHYMLKAFCVIKWPAQSLANISHPRAKRWTRAMDGATRGLTVTVPAWSGSISSSGALRKLTMWGCSSVSRLLSDNNGMTTGNKYIAKPWPPTLSP